ncbi:hypothetical protein UlMin_002189 [Ulmus minor]
MTTATNFSGSVPRGRVCLEAITRPRIVSLATKTTCNFGQNKLEKLQHKIRAETKAKTKLNPAMASRRSIGSDSNQVSPSSTLKEFYQCINEKKLKQLGDYISADCSIEESTFPTPIQGKQEALRFFEQLISSMGENVKFRVKDVCEGDGRIAAANWHLEWKDTEIPFTRGCSFFHCSKEGEKLVIKKAQIFIESTIKPGGGLVMTFFKIVTTIFDEFPKTTEWFLKSPHVILKWLLKINTMLVETYMNTVLKGYLQLWKFTTWFLSYAFFILSTIRRLFIN